MGRKRWPPGLGWALRCLTPRMYFLLSSWHRTRAVGAPRSRGRGRVRGGAGSGSGAAVLWRSSGDGVSASFRDERSGGASLAVLDAKRSSHFWSSLALSLPVVPPATRNPSTRLLFYFISRVPSCYLTQPLLTVIGMWQPGCRDLYKQWFLWGFCT